MRIFLLILLFLPLLSSAQENPPPIFECPECPTEQISSATYRNKSFGTILGGYQISNTWVPDKITGSYTQIFNRDWSLEVEYASSKKDITIAGYSLSQADEKRYTLFVKYYVGTSFHVSLGPYFYDISFAVNEKDDRYQVMGYGAALGIGNRWQYHSGLTWGIDWFRINRPLGETSNNISSGDGEKIEKAGKIFRTIPAFTMFGANIGYTF
jgi:hypothetical protein